MSKTFALIGAAGYIAERHIKAIKDNGGELTQIVDVNDSVGIIDRYFPNCEYSTKLNGSFDYVSICSPNFMHYDHIKRAIELGANVICEKPVVLKSHQINELKALADLKKVSIYCILQLRLHHLVNLIKLEQSKRVELTYITTRGDWYDKSWKGNNEKSGGLLFNIGIHLFDLLNQLYGNCYSYSVQYQDSKTFKADLFFEYGHIISVNLSTLNTNKETKRVLKVGNKSFDFGASFTDLHTLSYENIHKDEGFDINEAKASIELIEQIKG